jgi:hypothetical protein
VRVEVFAAGVGEDSSGVLLHEVVDHDVSKSRSAKTRT